MLIVGRISAQFLHNSVYWEESTVLTECLNFYTSINIRYGGIFEKNAESLLKR